MSAAQFQAFATGWIVAFVVLIPVITAALVLAINNVAKIRDAWTTINAHTAAITDSKAVLVEHDKALNGALDARIKAASDKAVSDALTRANPAPGGPLGPGGGGL